MTMETITYYSIRCVVRLIWCVPLGAVALLGRWIGGVVFYFDKRHRQRAIDNLRSVFGAEWDEGKIRAVAHENFKRLGENYASAIRMAPMSLKQLRTYVEVQGDFPVPRDELIASQRNQVVAIGHFGNFELYARLTQLLDAGDGGTTFRALKNKGASRAMEELRQFAVITFYERKRDVDQLKQRLREGGLTLGLLSDHYAGLGGMPCDFLGRRCSSSPAPIVLAMRYRATLSSAICYRVRLARWRIELGPEIPLRTEQGPRSVADVTQEVQNLLGDAVRRDPANWFWVHNRWRTVAKKRPARAAETKDSESPVERGADTPAS